MLCGSDLVLGVPDAVCAVIREQEEHLQVVRGGALGRPVMQEHIEGGTSTKDSNLDGRLMGQGEASGCEEPEICTEVFGIPTVSWSALLARRSRSEARSASREGRRSMKCSCATIVFTAAHRRGASA